MCFLDEQIFSHSISHYLFLSLKAVAMSISRRFSFLLALLFFMGFTQFAKAQQFTGDAYAKAKAAGKGTVTFSYVETPGFVYKDASGKLTGICIDIMQDFLQYVKDHEGIQLSARYVGNGNSFKAMYEGVKHGKGGVFGLGNITITDARKKEISFSPAFIQNFAILITNKSVPTLGSMSEIPSKFAGMHAYTAKGTLNEKRVMAIKKEYLPNLKVNYVGSSPEALDKVAKDPKSFTYLDLAFYFDAIKNNVPVKRHQVGDKGSEEFGIIMPKGSDWKPIMDEFFAANGGYRNSVSYKKILVKHLGVSAVKLLESTSN